MELTKQKIFISGANGYIGQYLRKKLHENFTKIEIINRANAIKISRKETTQSVLIYLSQPSSVIYKYNKNDIDFLNIILNKKWKHIIFFSTCLLNDYSLDSKKKDIPDYIRLKINSEKLLLGTSCTILRLSNVYGDKLKKNTFLHKLKIVRKKSEILKLTNQNHLRDFIHLSDIYHCIEKIILLKPKGIFNLGSGKSISTNKLIIFMSSKNKYIYNYLKFLKFKKKYDSKIELDIRDTKKKLKWEPTIFIH